MPKLFSQLFKQRQKRYESQSITASNGMSTLQHTTRFPDHCLVAHLRVMPEHWFTRTVTLEQQRSARSRTPFLLALLQVDKAPHLNGHFSGIVEGSISALASIIRDTDTIGWYREGMVLGVLFTELGSNRDPQATQTLIDSKLNTVLERELGDYKRHVQLSWHSFSESSRTASARRLADVAPYPSIGGHS